MKDGQIPSERMLAPYERRSLGERASTESAPISAQPCEVTRDNVLQVREARPRSGQQPVADLPRGHVRQQRVLRHVQERGL